MSQLIFPNLFFSLQFGYITKKKKKMRKLRPYRKKLVVVGDGFCGKTSLLHVFQHGEFHEVKKEKKKRL